MQTTNDDQLGNEPIKPHCLDMEKWTALIEEWRKTPESRKQFCQRLDLSTNTFAYACSKLSRQKKSDKKFIPVAIKQESDKKDNVSFCQIKDRNGMVFCIPTDICEEKLSELLTLLGWRYA